MESEPNTPKKLEEVAELIRFYGVPFLYECRVIYNKFSREDRQEM